jgi:hypothetical protein
LSTGIYVGYRLMAEKCDKLDFIRMLIPPLSLAGWMVLQLATAFDAVLPDLTDAPRTVSALFLTAILGVVATALAYKADQKPVPQEGDQASGLQGMSNPNRATRKTQYGP